MLTPPAPEHGSSRDSGSSPEAAAVRLQLGKILASPPFASAQRLQQFLGFIVEETLEGRSEDIKETVVAMRVFDRGSDFDPRIDSVVRVQASTLRNRLREYYLGPGRQDSVVVEVPRGSYVPVFRVVDHQAGRAPLPVATPPATRRVPVRFILAVATVLGLTAAGWWAFRYWRPMAPPSVAVLPFAILDSDPGSDHVRDGLVEDLTSALARAPSLRVAARTSAYQFDGKNIDIREIGRQLGVGALVEGSIRKVGDRFRVHLRLAKVSDGLNLWSDSFDGASQDISAFQERSANAIALALGEGRIPSGSYLAGARARDLYWQGRYNLRRGTAGRLKARSLFEEAVAVEPGYAQAHAALAYTCAHLVFHHEAAREETARATRGAAARALELDPAAVDAYLALGIVNYAYEWDWPSAERNFRRVLELSPSLARGHQIFAIGLLTRGRFDEALEELGRARTLDPLSHLVTNDRIVALYSARRFDEAIAQSREILRLDPKFVVAHVILGACLSAKGNHREAEAEFQTAIQALGRQHWILCGLAHSYALAGRAAEARALLAETEGLAGAMFVHRALVLAALGDKERAMEYLEKSAAIHETDLVFMGVESRLDPLRAEPRFKALKARLGL